MNYELALKLKNAGFPQSKEWLEAIAYGISSEDIAEGQERITKPSLSQLIDACGEDFKSLEKTRRTTANVGTCIFIAIPWEEEKYLKHIGSTPEESVADLWLALQNDKKQNEPKNTF